jgi:hypothetical protein
MEYVRRRVAGWQTRLGLVLLGITVLGACAGEEESRAQKCDRLREHFVELRVSGLPAQHREPHRAALRQALGERFEDECKSLTERQVACALAANDVVGATECSPSMR